MANGQIRGVNPVATVSPFFSDGFESGDLSHVENGAAWNTGGSGYQTVVTASPTPRTGTYAVQIRYLDWTPVDVTYTGDGATTAYSLAGGVGTVTGATPSLEVRVNGVLKTYTTDYTVSALNTNPTTITFVVAPPNGQSVRLTTNANKAPELAYDLGAGYTELWFEWYLYIPSNFAITAQPTGNNKLFYLWNKVYADVTGGSEMIGYEYNTRFPYNRPQDTSYARPVVGFSNYAGSIAGYFADCTDANCTGSGYLSKIIGAGNPLSPGAWHQMRCHVKAASAVNATDGILYLAVDGTVVTNIRNGPFWNYESWTGGTTITGASSGVTTLPGGGSPTANDYVGCTITMTSGVANGQSRTVTASSGAAMTHTPWGSLPSIGDSYTIKWPNTKFQRGYFMGAAGSGFDACPSYYGIDDVKFYSVYPGWG